MKRKIISLLSAAAIVLPAMAQNTSLKQEITVDRTIAPNERVATRLSGATPQVVEYNGKAVALKQAEYTRSSTLSSSLQFLEPASWRDTIAVTPWRGYAGVGYLPLYNLWATAGMKFIDNTKMRLNAWMQYDGSSYKARLADDYNPSFTSHQFNIAASGDYAFNTKSAINANIGIIYDWRNMPYIVLDNGKKATNTAAGVDFDATFTSKIKAVDYHAGVQLSYFGFGKDAHLSTAVTDPATQTVVMAPTRMSAAGEFMPGFNVGIGYTLKSIGRLTVDLTGNYEMNNAITTKASYTLPDGTVDQLDAVKVDWPNCGLTVLHPQLAIKSGKFTANVGFRASFYSYGKSQLNMAPDVRFSYEHSPNLSAFVNFTGSMEQMTLKRAFEISPYAMQSEHYGAENSPVNVDFGVNFGPYQAGFSASVFAGYNMVNDYLNPMVDAFNSSPVYRFMPVDLRGWHAGLKLAYSYRTLGEAHLAVETASQGINKGYAPWRDHAKYVLNIGVEANPLSKLTIGIDYKLRALRRGYAITALTQEVEGATVTVPAIGAFNLRNIGDLNLHATYSINEQWSAFANIENLLNRRTALVFGIPAMRIHGLLGVTYKIK